MCNLFSNQKQILIQNKLKNIYKNSQFFLGFEHKDLILDIY